MLHHCLATSCKLNIVEYLPLFRADLAGLGKHHMGGYGWIGVYRVNIATFEIN